MKIVVLDGYTLNPSDLSWVKLQELGEVIVYDRTSVEETIERARAADIILTNKTVLNGKTISELENLKYIGVLATGYNVVDIKAANKQSIIVTNVPAYSTKSVAQMVFALVLELTQNVGLHADAVKKMEWCESPDFSFWKSPLIELDGMTFGIVGYGQIGREVAKLANAFGMKVLVTTRSDINQKANYISQISIEELLKLSDIISLHLPLTSESENLITMKQLKLMKDSAYIVNTSRGPIVNETDLAFALNEGIIAGAGLDVLSTEPPSRENPLLKAKNCFITPHIAWATQASRQRLMSTAVENVKAFIQNNPKNVVN